MNIYILALIFSEHQLSTVRYVRCLGEGAFAQVHLVTIIDSIIAIITVIIVIVIIIIIVTIVIAIIIIAIIIIIGIVITIINSSYR